MRKLYLLALFFISFVVFGCTPEEDVCECYKYARDLWISYGTTDSFDSVQFFVNGEQVCNDLKQQNLGGIYKHDICIECEDDRFPYGSISHNCIEDANYLDNINQCKPNLTVRIPLVTCVIEEYCDYIDIDSANISLHIYPSKEIGKEYDKINFTTPSISGPLSYYADVYSRKETYPICGWNNECINYSSEECLDNYCFKIKTKLENTYCVHDECVVRGEFDCREDLNF